MENIKESCHQIQKYELKLALRVGHTVGKVTQQQESNKYSNMDWNTKNSIASDIRHQTISNSLHIIIVWILNFCSLNWKTIQNYTSGTHRHKTKYVKNHNTQPTHFNTKHTYSKTKQFNR